MNVYSRTMSEEVEYKGIQYKILEFLDNELLLVVKTEDFNRGEYPLKSLIIPNNIVG